MKYLIIVAHPDDEVLGCGATIAKLIEQGHQVDVAILAAGQSIRQSDEQAMQASKVLGVANLHLCTFPFQRMDQHALLEVCECAEAAIAKSLPDIIFTHSISDLNIEHGMVARAVITATRPLTNYAVSHVYSMEVPSSTEWSFSQIQPAFMPNTFEAVDTRHIKKKLEALAVYETEIRRSPHPRSMEILKAKAEVWGSMAGVKYAEPFQLIRAIRD